jgi:hypothetical protein
MSRSEGEASHATLGLLTEPAQKMRKNAELGKCSESASPMQRADDNNNNNNNNNNMGHAQSLLLIGPDALRLVMRRLGPMELYAFSNTCRLLKRLAQPIFERAARAVISSASGGSRKLVASICRRRGPRIMCGLLWTAVHLQRHLRRVQSQVHAAADRAIHHATTNRRRSNQCSNPVFVGRWDVTVRVADNVHAYGFHPQLAKGSIKFRLTADGMEVQPSKYIDSDNEVLDRLPDVAVYCEGCGRSVLCSGSPGHLASCARLILKFFNGESVEWWKLEKKEK